MPCAPLHQLVDIILLLSTLPIRVARGRGFCAESIGGRLADLFDRTATDFRRILRRKGRRSGSARPAAAGGSSWPGCPTARLRSSGWCAVPGRPVPPASPASFSLCVSCDRIDVICRDYIRKHAAEGWHEVACHTDA